MENKKQGGCRSGAGRPKGEKTVQISFRVIKENALKIQEHIKNLPISERNLSVFCKEEDKEKEDISEEVEKWLSDTVSSLFDNFLFYDRKKDDKYTVKRLQKLIDNGTISKELMLKVFIEQIENLYKD
jgi:hypothetical protein